MGLLDAIPGLAAHQCHQVDSPKSPVAEFDAERVNQLIREAQGLVSSMYPRGALEWLVEARPDVVRFLSEAEEAVDAAVLACDRHGFERALELWSRAHRKAFAVYNERPAVIERQENLFGEAL